MAYRVSTGFEVGLARAFSGSIQAVDNTTTPFSYGYCIRMNIGDTCYFTGGLDHATAIVGVHLREGANAGIGGFLAFQADSGATTHVTISHHTDGTIKAYRGTTAGTLLGTSAGTVNFTAWHFWEAKVTLSDTVGTVEVKVDGVTMLSLTGLDTKNAGTDTAFDRISLFTSLQHSTYFDNFYLLDGTTSSGYDDFWGEVNIRTLVPTGAGATTGLTPSAGSNWACVDDAFGSSGSSADYVGSAVAATKDTYVVPDLPASVPTIKMVSWGGLCAKTDAGAISGRRVIRVNGVDYTGSDLTLGVGYAWFFDNMATSPDTSTTWTKTEVDACQPGYEVRA